MRRSVRPNRDRCVHVSADVFDLEFGTERNERIRMTANEFFAFGQIETNAIRFLFLLRRTIKIKRFKSFVTSQIAQMKLKFYFESYYYTESGFSSAAPKKMCYEKHQRRRENCMCCVCMCVYRRRF